MKELSIVPEWLVEVSIKSYFFFFFRRKVYELRRIFYLKLSEKFKVHFWSSDTSKIIKKWKIILFFFDFDGFDQINNS